MKKILLLGAVITTLALPAIADIYTFNSGFANGGLIPDFPASGWSDTRALLPGGPITDVNVMLNISGGWNGDLQGFLRFEPTGGGIYFAQLLNRVGKGAGSEPQFTYGFSTAGFNNVWLDDQAVINGNIHNVQNPTPGAYYLPDGGLLSVVNGLNGNGNWTLFLQDKSSGDQSTVASWALDIATAAVPEPGVWPVALLIALVAGVKVNQYVRGRKTA